MNAKKENGPARDLIWTAIFCFVLGLVVLLFSLWVYLFYWDKMKLAGSGPGADSFSENVVALMRILLFGLLPLLGFAFSCVGYVLWKHYDQGRTLRKPPE